METRKMIATTTRGDLMAAVWPLPIAAILVITYYKVNYLFVVKLHY